MSFKPKAVKLSGFRIQPTDVNGTSITIRISGLNPHDKVEIIDSDGTSSGSLLLKDLLWSSEVLKSFDKRFNCVCAQHGSFVSDHGYRQAPSCSSCMTAVRQEMATDMVDEETDA